MLNILKISRAHRKLSAQIGETRSIWGYDSGFIIAKFTKLGQPNYSLAAQNAKIKLSTGISVLAQIPEASVHFHFGGRRLSFRRLLCWSSYATRMIAETINSCYQSVFPVNESFPRCRRAFVAGLPEAAALVATRATRNTHANEPRANAPLAGPSGGKRGNWVVPACLPVAHQNTGAAKVNPTGRQVSGPRTRHMEAPSLLRTELEPRLRGIASSRAAARSATTQPVDECNCARYVAAVFRWSRSSLRAGHRPVLPRWRGKTGTGTGWAARKRLFIWDCWRILVHVTTVCAVSGPVRES